jgi:hypothetical protein
MRFVSRDLQGKLILTEFLSNAVPKYIIVSHRWQQQEVAYEDMKNGTGKHRQGWN